MEAMPPETALQPNRQDVLASLVEQTRRWSELDIDHWLEIRMLRPDYNPLNQRFRTDIGALEIATDVICEWNAKGYSAYSVRNPIHNDYAGNAKDDDIIAAFHLFADCDTEDAGKALRDFVGPKYTYAITTGTIPYHRPHPYWELEQPITDLEAWTATQRGIARRLGGDSVVINPSRIMRIAGTITWPDDRKKDRGYVSELVTIRTEYPEPRDPIPFDQMERAFAAPAPTPSASATTPIDPTSINTGPASLDRRQAVASAASGQEWHNNIIKLVASYVSKGLDDLEIHSLTDPLTLAGFTIEQTRAEVQKAIDGARAKGWTPEPVQAPSFDHAEPVSSQTPEDTPSESWSVQSAADFTADFVAPEYLIHGVVQRGRLFTLTAPTGHGKTAAMLYAAMQVASGSQFCFRDVKQGSVLFMAGENPDDVRARVIMAMEAYSLDPDALPLNFIAGTFSIRQCLQRLETEAAKMPDLALIVVDTFAAYFDGDDENNNAQALDFARLIRKLTSLPTKPAVIMPAHPTKNAARSNLIPKGGSSLLNEVDGNLSIWNDEGTLRMHWQGKHRGPDFDPLTMELKTCESSKVCDSDGILMPSVVAHPVGELRAMDLAGKTMEKETALLLSIDNSPYLPERERATQVGIARSSMKRTLKRMMDRKWIKKSGLKDVLTGEGLEALKDAQKGHTGGEYDV